jgi:hypothetical protein
MAYTLPCKWVIIMKWQSSAVAAPVQTAPVPQTSDRENAVETQLDLVVPFTTPELTRAAVAAASRMAAGLNAAIRLIKIQCVPFPMEPDQSPVFLDFLRQQMESFRSPLPLTSEIRLAREFEQGLSGALHPNSIVVLSFRQRPWRTRNERLASALRKAGRRVILLPASPAEGTIHEVEYNVEHNYA